MMAVPAREIQKGFLGLFEGETKQTTFIVERCLSVRVNFDGNLSAEELPSAPILLPRAIRFSNPLYERGTGVRASVQAHPDFAKRRDWLGRRIYVNTKHIPKPKDPAKWQCKLGHVIRSVLAPHS